MSFNFVYPLYIWELYPASYNISLVQTTRRWAYSNDNYVVNIYVDLPQLLFDLKDRELGTLDCPADLEDFSFGICMDYAPVFEQYLIKKYCIKH